MKVFIPAIAVALFTGRVFEQSSRASADLH